MALSSLLLLFESTMARSGIISLMVCKIRGLELPQKYKHKQHMLDKEMKAGKTISDLRRNGSFFL